MRLLTPRTTSATSLVLLAGFACFTLVGCAGSESTDSLAESGETAGQKFEPAEAATDEPSSDSDSLAAAPNSVAEALIDEAPPTNSLPAIGDGLPELPTVTETPESEMGLATDVAWTEDFEGAKQTAVDEGRDILMDFTGSDWCGWCIRLDNEVFRYAKFSEYADENFVLVKLDYPRDRSKMSEETVAQNAELQSRFAIQGYPTILLADAEGRPYAQTGYQRGGPDAYVEHLEQLKQVRVERDKAFAAAENLEGVERAKQLNKALQTLDQHLVLPSYESVVEEIVALDADNEAGLKEQLGSRLLASQFESEMMAIQSLAQTGDADAALEKLTEVEKKFASFEAGHLSMKLFKVELLKLAGNVEELIPLADALLKRDGLPLQQRFSVYAAKLNAFAGASRFEDALTVIDDMQKQFPDEPRLSLQLLLSKANFLAQLGRETEGREAIAEARKIADPSAAAMIDQAETQLFPPAQDDAAATDSAPQQ